MVPGIYWSNYTGASESWAEIQREDTDFCEDGQTLAQVAQRANGVSALGMFKTRWEMALSILFQLMLL